MSKYRREYYLANKERFAERKRIYREEHKEHNHLYAIQYYKKNRKRLTDGRTNYVKLLRRKVVNLLGSKCIKCGISDYRVLAIDHVNNDGSKERKIMKSISIFYTYLLNLNHEDKTTFFKRYQILCHNCNWIKRIESSNK